MNSLIDRYFYDDGGNIIKEKTCLKCKNIKPFSEFTKSRNGKYKLHNFCKTCLCEYNKKNYEQNKDKKKRQVEIWSIDNSDKVIAYKRKYYYKKKGKIPPEIEEKNPLDDLPPIDPLNF